mmetsp:Transcript_22463/g.55656  ORF Transcript_22463/g.55656 Transcript_22463/m.55656 type:complete len:108 (+) Transcript_22463:623-946(+)
MTWSDPVLEHVYRTELKAVEARQNARLARISLEESNRRSLENLRQMEAELAKSTTGWICDTKKPKVADYVQSVVLHRMMELGQDDGVFQHWPKIKGYVERLLAFELM